MTKSDIEAKTEALNCATQKEALKVNYIKHNFDRIPDC